MERMTKQERALYEAWKKSKMSRIEHFIVFGSSTVLAVACFLILILVQKKQYDGFYGSFSDNTTAEWLESMNATWKVCEHINYFNIPVVNAAIAICLVLCYSILYKRRSFWINKFKTRRFGLVGLDSFFSLEW